VTDKRFAALSANKQGNGDSLGILSLERKPFFVDLFFKLFCPLLYITGYFFEMALTHKS